MRFGSLGLLVFLAACNSDKTTTATTPAPPDGGAPATSPTTPITTATSNPCQGGVAVTSDAFVAQGLCASLIAPAASVPNLRQISFAPNGDLFGTTATGSILLMRDDDKDGAFSAAEIHTWGNTGGNGSNAHVDATGGFVYAGSETGVKRFPYDPAALAAPSSEDVVINQPDDGAHGKHTTHVYDGFLYVHSGSSGNQSHEDDNPIGEYDTTRGLIKRFDLSKFVSGTPFDWKDGEVFTQGLRNALGVTRNETTGKMYAVVNGMDDVKYGGQDVHIDNPGEQILEVAKGKAYGYPFCFTAQRIVNGSTVVAPGTQLSFAGFGGHDDAWCAANASAPAAFIQAHSAPLDISFFDKQPAGNLPERWRGGAFIALHGSWDRIPATGYKVVWQPFNADGTSTMPTSTTTATTFPYEVVFGGAANGQPQDGPWQWHSTTGGDTPRPSGVAISPLDGALYISSDSPGALYRVGVQH